MRSVRLEGPLQDEREAARWSVSARLIASDRTATKKGFDMSHVTYTVVEHDGGWAYKVGDVFSETFASRDATHAAAKRAAREQRVPGENAAIEFEDSSGRWREEDERGDDRPDTEVQD
jgi:hypothetical protein